MVARRLHLFKKHFPEWLNEKTVEEAMKRTTEEFQKRGVECFYNSLNAEAKRERWEKREAKITTRKNKIKLETVKKLSKKIIFSRRFLIYNRWRTFFRSHKSFAQK